MRILAVLMLLLLFPWKAYAGISVKSPNYTVEILDQVRDLSLENASSYYLSNQQIKELKKQRILDLSTDKDSFKVILDKDNLVFSKDSFSSSAINILTNKNYSVSFSNPNLGDVEGVSIAPTICHKSKKCSASQSNVWSDDEYGWGMSTDMNLNKYSKFYSLTNQQKIYFNQKKGNSVLVNFAIRQQPTQELESTLNNLDIQIEAQ